MRSGKKRGAGDHLGDLDRAIITAALIEGVVSVKEINQRLLTANRAAVSQRTVWALKHDPDVVQALAQTQAIIVQEARGRYLESVIAHGVLMAAALKKLLPYGLDGGLNLSQKNSRSFIAAYRVLHDSSRFLRDSLAFTGGIADLLEQEEQVLTEQRADLTSTEDQIRLVLAIREQTNSVLRQALARHSP